MSDNFMVNEHADEKVFEQADEKVTEQTFAQTTEQAYRQQSKEEPRSFLLMSEELEGIVRQLEGNQLELEQNLLLYERGVHLLRDLQKQLDEAEQKVTVLLGQIESENDEATDTTLS